MKTWRNAFTLHNPYLCHRPALVARYLRIVTGYEVRAEMREDGIFGVDAWFLLSDEEWDDMRFSRHCATVKWLRRDLEEMGDRRVHVPSIGERLRNGETVLI